jgi:F-type H+-transporting ATPase subunit delta
MAQLASEATGVSGLAGRYATALFELADQQKKLDEVAEDLRALSGLIAESADLRRLIRSPVLSRESQGAAMAKLVERAELSQMTRNFIGVVARNRRLFALPAVITAYLTQLALRRGEIRAEVTAAQAMTESQVTAINDQLKRAIGSKVAVEIRVDPAIIGGLVVKVGSRMVDGSLRSKLQRLQLAMRGI